MLELHRRAMRHSVQVVDLVHDDQLDRPTPCTQWTLRQLLEHMITENRGFAAAAAGEVSDRTVWETTALDGDFRAAYGDSADRVIAAFGADGVLDTELWLPKIAEEKFPARQAVSFHLLDYVVHSWDVAAAIGHPIVFEDDLVAVVQEIADREAPDGPRRHRPNASFAPPVAAPDGAPAQDRLLAMLGRPPRWPN